MNEIQILQMQLATERLHFSQVTNACATASGTDGDFAAACVDYFAFAVTRFDAVPGQKLAAGLAAGGGPEFLRAFADESRRHFERLDGRLTQNRPVTQWRAAAGIDADSIFAERARYERVKATLPAGVILEIFSPTPE